MTEVTVKGHGHCLSDFALQSVLEKQSGPDQSVLTLALLASDCLSLATTLGLMQNICCVKGPVVRITYSYDNLRDMTNSVTETHEPGAQMHV